MGDISIFSEIDSSQKINKKNKQYTIYDSFDLMTHKFSTQKECMEYVGIKSRTTFSAFLNNKSKKYCSRHKIIRDCSSNDTSIDTRIS